MAKDSSPGATARGCRHQEGEPRKGRQTRSFTPSGAAENTAFPKGFLLRTSCFRLRSLRSRLRYALAGKPADKSADKYALDFSSAPTELQAPRFRSPQLSPAATNWS